MNAIPPELATAKKTRPSRTGVVVATGLVLALGGFWGWRWWSHPISQQELTAFLDHRVGEGNVHFTSVEEERSERLSDGRVRLKVAATGRTSEPLYAKIDAGEYLRHELHLDPLSQAGPESEGGPARPDLSSPEPSGTPADPFQATLLKLREPAEATIAYTGTLEATREHNGWDFTIIREDYGGSAALPGETRSSFATPNFVADDPKDVAALTALASARSSYVAHRTAARDQARAGRLQTFLAQLAPGSLYRGAAVESDGRTSGALFLEISDLDRSGHGVTAALRNDGGWRDARVFHGEWHSDADCRSFTLTLTSRPNEAIRNSGPFLENTQVWTFDFTAGDGGSLSAADRMYRYRFTPLTGEQASSVKSELRADLDAELAATRPGMIYRGMAISRSTQVSEPVMLRFIQQDSEGAALQAQFESPEHKWHRGWAGAIIANGHRTAGAPIRLESAGSDAERAAGDLSVLGVPNDLALRLRLDGTNLIGEDASFAYRFAPAATSDLKQLDAARAARARRFAQAVLTGIDYDGAIRDEQGYVVRTRLHVSRVDLGAGTVTATIETHSPTPIFREFSGACDPADGSIALASTTRGNLDSSGDLGVPLFSANRRFTLQVALTEDALVGHIDNDEHTTLEYPIRVFLADPGPLPARPANYGAYILKDGGWVPLPRNNGHAVAYKPPAKRSDAARQASEVFHQAAQLLLRVPDDDADTPKAAVRAGKSSDLIFDGKDPVPAIEGSRVIVLYVGHPEESTRAEGVKPAGGTRGISEWPAVEIAPTETNKKGERTVERVHANGAAETFGNQRIAAYVHNLSPGTLLLTATDILEAGSYAVSAEEGYELAIR